jgi:Calcineurin-like phosphoesterase
MMRVSKFMLLFVLLMAATALLLGCDGSDDDDTATDDDTPTGDDDDDDTPTGDDDDDDDDDDDNDDDDNDDDDNDDDDDDDDVTPTDCPAQITRQPYLQLARQDSMHVLWRTDVEGDSAIEWGPTEELGHWVSSDEMTLHHELIIDGLEAGQTYYYKARSCLDETDVAPFRTAPEPGDSFSFVAFADNQAGWETFTQLVPLMLEREPDLAFSAGDCVDNGRNPEDFEQQLFGPGEQLWRQAPLYVSIGNHEHNSSYFYESFRFPNRDKPYYAFLYGDVFFLALALDEAHPAIPGSPQYKYMIEALSSDAAQNASFRAVFFHTPPWTEGWEGYVGDWMARLFIVPVMEEYDVDVYFNGHTHDYERGLRNGVANYIIGGGGGTLDPWARDVEHITVYEAVHHFVHVEVDETTMTINAIGLDGEVFDTYEITH